MGPGGSTPSWSGLKAPLNEGIALASWDNQAAGSGLQEGGWRILFGQEMMLTLGWAWGLTVLPFLATDFFSFLVLRFLVISDIYILVSSVSCELHWNLQENLL